MEKNNVKNFLDACDELINGKYLVAEYKIQKLLQELANSSDVCSLVGDCLEQFNRDREFSKAFIQDGHGDFVFVAPKEEFKIIALVFCTLVDIENKKIDFVDFVKRFFGREEVPFKAFLSQMIVPFTNLIAEAFGYGVAEEPDEDVQQVEEHLNTEEHYNEEESQDEAEGDYENRFVRAQKLAVQILTQLEFSKQDYNTEVVMQICRAIVKTTDLEDEDVAAALAFALKNCKAKEVKYLLKEIIELLS